MLMTSIGTCVTVSLPGFLVAFDPVGDPGFLNSGEFYPLALALVFLALGVSSGLAVLAVSAVAARHRLGVQATVLVVLALVVLGTIAAQLIVQSAASAISALPPEATGALEASDGARQRIAVPAGAAVGCLVVGPIGVGIALTGRRFAGVLVAVLPVVAAVLVLATAVTGAAVAGPVM